MQKWTENSKHSDVHNRVSPNACALAQRFPPDTKYGEPMNFTALRAEAKTCTKERLKQIYQEAADELMAAIGKLQPCWDKAEFP